MSSIIALTYMIADCIYENCLASVRSNSAYQKFQNPAVHEPVHISEIVQ